MLNNLDLAANLAQFYSLFILLKDASNEEILRELNHQNSDFLEKIVEQNKIIIEQNEQILKLLGE